MFRRLFIAAFVVGVSLSTTAPQASAQLVTKPINKPVLFPAWNYILHIKSIEAHYPTGKPPFLGQGKGKMEDCPQGYILIIASLQNNNSSGSAWIPSLSLGFELADGSQMNGPSEAGTYIYPSYAQPAPSLYAKEHLNLVYVTCGWTGQPITKLVVANSIRFIVPKKFVKMHAAAPASPSP